MLKLTVISARVKCIVTVHDMFCWFHTKTAGAAMTIFYFSTLPFLTVGNLIKGDRALNSLSRNSPATKIKFSSLSHSITRPRLELRREERTTPNWLWRQTTSLIDFFPENSLFWYQTCRRREEKGEKGEVGEQQMMMIFYSIHLALL